MLAFVMLLVWKRVIDSQAEKLKELDKEIRPFRQNWEEADSMKSSVESLQNRVTELESVDKSSGQAARNTGERRRATGSACLRGTGRHVADSCDPGTCCGSNARGRRSPRHVGPGRPGYRCSVCQAAGLLRCLGLKAMGPTDLSPPCEASGQMPGGGHGLPGRCSGGDGQARLGRGPRVRWRFWAWGSGGWMSVWSVGVK